MNMKMCAKYSTVRHRIFQLCSQQVEVADTHIEASVVVVKRIVLNHVPLNPRSHRLLEHLCIAGSHRPRDGGIFRRRSLPAVDVVRVVQIENSISFLLQRNLADVSPPPTKLLGILEMFTPRSCWGT